MRPFSNYFLMGNRLSKGQLLLFLLSQLCIGLVVSTGYARAQSSRALETNLHLDFTEDNSLTGNLDIRAHTPRTSSIAIYTILPFRIEGALNTDRGVYASYEIYNRVQVRAYTVLHVILSTEASDNTQISFQIRPTIQKSSDFAFASLASSINSFNTLIIEDRGSSRNTLYFKFDSKSKSAFAGMSNLTDSMLVPQEITISFPPETIFDATPPTFVSSNIMEGAVPGKQQGSSFVTPIQFYEGQALRINYILQSLTMRPGVIIYATILLLIAFVPGILTFPDDMLKKRLRLAIATFSFIFSIVLFIFNLYFEGTAYLEQNVPLLIGGIIAYLFVGIVLLLQTTQQIKQVLNVFKSKFRLKP